MRDFTGHYGHWPLAVLMVAIASWVVYRYLAPTGWREWSGAGALQAFIIALYAEMYGFPLTIYLLSGFLGIDVPLTSSSGHLWATLLGYGPGGAMVEMLLGFALIIAGLLLITGGWREVYRASREGRLATDGPYGAVRHPQYTGIMLAVLGQVVHWPTIPTVALLPVIVLLYVWLARSEEARMVERFGDEYLAYRRRVPRRFIPRRGSWRRLWVAAGPAAPAPGEER